VVEIKANPIVQAALALIVRSGVDVDMVNSNRE
jgi:hypothetical protein